LVLLSFSALSFWWGWGRWLIYWPRKKKEIPKPLTPEKTAVQEVSKLPAQEKWTLKSIQKSFNDVKDEINYLDGIKSKPGKGASIKGFFSRVEYAFRLTMQEKEIITFALLQWSAIAVAIIQLFLRPIYIISSCDIFSDYLEERQEKVMLPRPPSKGISAFVAFLVLVLVLAIVFIFRYDLGIMNMLSTPYGQDYVPK